MKKSTTIIIIATFLFVAGCLANFHYQTTKADAYNKVMKDADDTYEKLNQVKELKQQLESLKMDFDRLCEISKLD